jgi:hypothetical protein
MAMEKNMKNDKIFSFLIMFLILIAIAAFSILYFNQRVSYGIVNMIDGIETVDVTDLILEEKYEPIYSQNNDIIALVNPHPNMLGDSNDSTLSIHIKTWLSDNYHEYNADDIGLKHLSKKTTYKYTYFILLDPIDVYLTEIKIDNETLAAFIRAKNGAAFGPYSTRGWVFPIEMLNI